MSIILRVSYETDGELMAVQKALAPLGLRWTSEEQKGQYRRCYGKKLYGSKKLCYNNGAAGLSPGFAENGMPRKISETKVPFRVK